MKSKSEKYTWTKEGVKKLLYTIDHFCEMVLSFASKFNFLDASQRMDLKSYHTPKGGDNFLRDDPTDPVMVERVLPYIRDVSLLLHYSTEWFIDFAIQSVLVPL